MALLKYPILNNLTSPDAANTELKQVKRRHSIFFCVEPQGYGMVAGLLKQPAVRRKNKNSLDKTADIYYH